MNVIFNFLRHLETKLLNASFSVVHIGLVTVAYVSLIICGVICRLFNFDGFL